MTKVIWQNAESLLVSIRQVTAAFVFAGDRSTPRSPL